MQEASFGEEINGLVSLGDTPPQSINDLSYVPSTVDAGRPDRWFLTKSYQIGDVVKFEDRYLEFTQDVLRGTEVDELAKAMQAVAYNQERSYSAGDFIELNGDFYQFIGDVGAFADETVVAANLSEVIGSDVLPFDGKIKFIENQTQNSKKSRKVLVRLD